MADSTPMNSRRLAHRPRRASLRLLCLAAAAASTLVTGLAGAAEDGVEYIVPPKQEGLLLQMLAEAKGAKLAGCGFDTATVVKTHVQVKYLCAGKEARFELRHPSVAGSAVKTAQFALVPGQPAPSAALIEAVAAQIRSREAGWRWSQTDPSSRSGHDGGSDSAEGSGSGQGSAPRKLPLVAAMDAFTLRKEFDQATAAAFLLLQREPSYGGGAQRLQDALRRSLTSLETAEKVWEIGVKVATPEAQATAGMAAFRAAFALAPTEEKKRALYQKAITALEAAAKSLPASPTLLSTLALAHRRGGDAAKARTLVDQAVTLAPTDLRLLLVRAEVRQLTEPKLALADLGTFEASIAKGARNSVSPLDRALASSLKAHLEELLSRKDAKPREVMDTLPNTRPALSEDLGNATDAAPSVPTDPVEEAMYEAGHLLSKKEHFPEAFSVYVQLARRNPRFSAVMGRIVATLAPILRGPETAQPFVDLAERNQGDHLLQFIAGVACHYAAHNGSRTAADKTRLYKLAITHLQRARPSFDYEARVYIYLGVSHFRLGLQKEAEALVEQAVARGRDDPDAYYCRAEVFQRVNVPKALKDLDVYLSMAKRLIARGAIIGKGKQERVQRMQAHLRAVAAGIEKPVEIFDPLAGDEPLGMAPGPGPATPAPALGGTGSAPPRPQGGERDGQQHGGQVQRQGSGGPQGGQQHGGSGPRQGQGGSGGGKLSPQLVATIAISAGVAGLLTMALLGWVRSRRKKAAAEPSKGPDAPR